MASEIRMESSGGSELAQPPKPTKFIEWNVDMDMQVTVLNSKRPKIYQKPRNIVIFFLVIFLAVFLSHLRKEVRALQVQMQTMNANLFVLMTKYERLNRNLNRSWSHKSKKYQEEKGVVTTDLLYERAVEASRNIARLLDDAHNRIAGNSYAHNSDNSLFDPSKRLSETLSNDEITHSQFKARDNLAIETATAKVENLENTDHERKNKSRFQRAVSNVESENSTIMKEELNRDRIENNDQMDMLNSSVEARSGRARRDEGRGKKRPRNRRRPKRSRERLGPLVATFVGAIPEQHVTDSVHVGPWVKNTKNDSQYGLNKFHLVEDRKAIEVTTSGLYMISAQIFYFGEPTNYSYWILLTSEGKSSSQKLVKCSTAYSASATEVSCYTSIIVSLRKGDRIHVQQQERNRLINMREGHSFVQLVLLSPGARKRRAV